MKVNPTDLEGVFALDLFHSVDERGVFVKTFHAASFEEHGLQTKFDESFYSTSDRGVVRGMHFQLPPHDHDKLIYCTSGRLMDVILDLRKASPTYGKATSVELSGDNFRAVYIPKGCAHGFAVLEDKTNMVYLTSTMHHPSSDTGVLWNSFGFEWPFDNPIQSERDKQFIPFSEFESPF